MSIAENFNQHFHIQFANTKELKEEAFKIRYGVYSHELGWEAKNNLQMEIDECDDYAYHCLLKHRRTGTYAGCVRLIIPPIHEPELQLPFEKNFLHSARTDIIDSTKLARGSFGEISRLAVLSSFRRRKSENRKPFVMNDIEPEITFTEEEHRNFPNIAIGLYLASVTLSEICNHQDLFVIMEKRLHRGLFRIGLQFEKVGDTIDYHGKRAMYHLPREKFSANLKPELKELYDSISAELLLQQYIVPFSNAGCRL
ncbi:PEP-CTERM/exosortase system-associated acyltransferase [Cognaticolwellia beringensis]|uniref:PEP-CTERM/exosortase system-associated acyltransferase n=1 Tax=Cognaticolwellia beringensis TaxID=1967665 RepID=A0A222G874_9GAMM|nr:PEP-CTERM/exosortase system-associated acyltransferase [Cognaticolwellia beringensis]ASP48001.1 PEP-CTERM/exosortase system-associated acyltransferase [Cognaticolwellia beringensis]